MHALAVRAQAAKAEAERHKRALSRHRGLLRQARARQAELEAECRRRGIQLIDTGEGNAHGRQAADPRP